MLSLDFLLFQIFPYFAVGVMVFGGIYRIKTAPYTVTSKSSQLIERNGMKIGSNFFHIGILALLIGHVFGLFTPVTIVDELGIEYYYKQMAAILFGGVAAVLCFIGLFILIVRRYGNQRVSNNSSFGDKFVIMLIMAQLIVGIASIRLSLAHPEGAEMLTFMSWANALARFDSDAYMIVVGVSPLFKLHFIFGVLIFASLPFTRLIHIFRIPIAYLYRPYLVIRKKI